MPDLQAMLTSCRLLDSGQRVLGYELMHVLGKTDRAEQHAAAPVDCFEDCVPVPVVVCHTHVTVTRRPRLNGASPAWVRDSDEDPQDAGPILTDIDKKGVWFALLSSPPIAPRGKPRNVPRKRVEGSSGSQIDAIQDVLRSVA